LRQAKRPADAEPVLRRSLQLWTELADTPAARAQLRAVTYLLGCVLSDLGRHADAAEQFRACLTLPGAEPAAFRTGQAVCAIDLTVQLWAAGKPADARPVLGQAKAMLEDLIAETPTNLATRLRLAALLTYGPAEDRDPARAQTLARSILQLDERNGPAWTAMALARLRGDDAAGAEAALDKAAKLPGGNSALEWLIRSLARTRHGDAAGARHWLQRAVSWQAENRSADIYFKLLYAEAAAAIDALPKQCDQPLHDDAVVVDVLRRELVHVVDVDRAGVGVVDPDGGAGR
jgi:tetratricopeptide (TPR) repeat protein